MNTVEELRKEQKNLLIGTEKALTGLRSGEVKKVFVSSNCPDSVKKDIERLGKISNTEIVMLDFPNDELGVVCKKQFSISVVSLPK